MNGSAMVFTIHLFDPNKKRLGEGGAEVPPSEKTAHNLQRLRAVVIQAIDSAPSPLPASRPKAETAETKTSHPQERFFAWFVLKID